ncbi:hypothetical protein KIPB_010868, partial [Kipferlia bialata]
TFPDKAEGWMTQAKMAWVCNDTLTDVMDETGLSAYIRVGNGTCLSERMKADAAEAILGAVLQDAGWDAACSAALHLLSAVEDALIPPDLLVQRDRERGRERSGHTRSTQTEGQTCRGHADCATQTPPQVDGEEGDVVSDDCQSDLSDSYLRCPIGMDDKFIPGDMHWECRWR